MSTVFRKIRGLSDVESPGVYVNASRYSVTHALFFTVYRELVRPLTDHLQQNHTYPLRRLTLELLPLEVSEALVELLSHCEPDTVWLSDQIRYLTPTLTPHQLGFEFSRCVGMEPAQRVEVFFPLTSEHDLNRID